MCYFIKPSIRNKIVRRDNSKCCYCNKPVSKKNRSLDHITPQTRGGANKPSNLVLTCKSCNSQKGSKSLKEYTQYLILEGILNKQAANNIHKRVYNRLSTGV
jgi:5-methylcytosine-specific restriction endonuclease McrA